MIASELAAQGFKVFPCGADKRPLVAWKEAATDDVGRIAEWRQQWPKAMVGLPCGAANNLFVLDLDTDKCTGERKGENSLRSLGYARLLDGPTVKTPSGGVHIYFRHFEGARNSVARLGDGIDTRGEGGFVIAPGSRNGSGRYVGVIPNPLPTFPLALRAMLCDRPRLARSVADPARSVSDTEADELLGYIEPDCDYQTWVTVLMALHARYGGSESGLIVADAWSARGTKYRPGEVASKWRSFKGMGVTWASVPALARERGADLSAISRRHAA